MSLLSSIYVLIDGTDISSIEQLKKITFDILNNNKITVRFSYNKLIDPDHFKTEILSSEFIEHLKKSIQDDIASLRRIGRVPGCEGINCKLIIKSG
jgi:hypothetical protein